MKTFIAASLCLFASATVQAQSTQNGVYTEEQATRGAEFYEQACAMCHGVDLAGNFETPNLRGYFIGLWTGAPVERLYDYISTAMPLYAPGSLPPDAYADVVAYLLKANGAPAADTPLPHDPAALRTIIINAPAK